MSPVNQEIYRVLSKEINNLSNYFPSLNSITPVPGQCILVTYGNYSFVISLDSGATVSFMKLETAQRLGLKILPNGQLALLADEKTRMQSIGEINVLVNLGHIVLRMRALIVSHLQVECYAGTTFHVDNGVKADISAGTILLHHGKFKVNQYNPPSGGKPRPYHPPMLSLEPPPVGTAHCAALTHSDLAQSPVHVSTDMTSPCVPDAQCSSIQVMTTKSVEPGGSYHLRLNAVQCKMKNIALIPQFSRLEDPGSEWQPQMVMQCIRTDQAPSCPIQKECTLIWLL